MAEARERGREDGMSERTFTVPTTCHRHLEFNRHCEACVAVVKAGDLGHALEAWESAGVSGYPRATCARCGDALLFTYFPYGSAIERPCAEDGS